MPFLKAAVVMACLASACGHSSQPGASGGEAPSAAFPRSSQFCSGHVTGAPQGGQPGPHISWTAHSSTDAPSQVLSQLEAHLEGEQRRESGSSGVSLEVQNGASRRVLSVHTATDQGPWTTCDVPQGTVTIILDSTMVGGS